MRLVSNVSSKYFAQQVIRDQREGASDLVAGRVDGKQNYTSVLTTARQRSCAGESVSSCLPSSRAPCRRARIFGERFLFRKNPFLVCLVKG